MISTVWYIMQKVVLNTGVHSTFTATDNGTPAKSDSQSVSLAIADVTAPTITVTPDTVTLQVGSTLPDLLAGVSADDGSIITTTGSVDVGTTGTYTITYHSTDNSGNVAAAVSRTYTVSDILDTTPPTITVTPDTITLEVNSKSPSLLEGVSTNDGSPITVTGTGDINIPGTYILTYHSTDLAGNQAVAVTRTYIIVDTTPPTITVEPTTITLEVNSTSPGLLEGVSTNDGSPITVTGTGDINIPGTYILTYHSTDLAGNIADPVSRTYIIVEQLSLSATIITSPSTVYDKLFTFSGTSTGADEVALYIDEMYTNRVIYPDETGDWAFNVMLVPGENTLGVVATNESDMTSPDDIIITFDDTTIINDSFDDWDGWEKYSYVLTNIHHTAFEDYDLSLDSTTGKPAPSVRITGDGFFSQAGIQKTIDISSVDEDSPLYISFDYMTASENGITDALTGLRLFDGVTGEKIYGRSLISGDSQHNIWKNHSQEISNIVSGHDSIIIRIFMYDYTPTNESQQNWYDNVYLGTIEPPMGQSSPPAMILSDDIIYSSSNASNDTSLSAIINTPSDVITDTEHFVISGTSTGADQIALYRDGTYTNEWVIPDETGDWAFNVILVPGENVLGVTVVNEFDMTSPSDITVTLDIIE